MADIDQLIGVMTGDEGPMCDAAPTPKNLCCRKNILGLVTRTPPVTILARSRNTNVLNVEWNWT